MRNYLLVLLALTIITSSLAFGRGKRKHRADREFLNDTTVSYVVRPAAGALSRNWAFVVDTSHSGQNVYIRTIRAFRFLTQHMSDEFNFCLFTFNARSNTQFLEWQEGSVEALLTAERFIDRHRGVLSHGKTAIQQAIQQPIEELTVVFIGDGGFTSACDGKGFNAIRNAIQTSQQWRIDNGYNYALICAIGIQNIGYTNGGKPSDVDCQSFLEEVGTEWAGGYALVHPNN